MTDKVTVRDDGVTREEIHERGPDVVERRSGGGGLMIGLALLVAVLIGGWFLYSQNNRDAAQTTAVTKAADDVGKAAGDVADSVGNALDNEK